MCLMQGLVKGEGNLDLNCIAEYYGDWICSPPFDIGNTTRNSLKILKNQDIRDANSAI